MSRVLPTPPTPAPLRDAQEFARPFEFTRTTDARDLARALGEGKSHTVGGMATRVLTPDEQ
jgi:hypothetical protein